MYIVIIKIKECSSVKDFCLSNYCQKYECRETRNIWILFTKTYFWSLVGNVYCVVVPKPKNKVRVLIYVTMHICVSHFLVDIEGNTKKVKYRITVCGGIRGGRRI